MTDDGIVILSNDKHFLNAEFEIDVIEEGRVISNNEWQLLKHSFPIVETESGMEIDINNSQYRNGGNWMIFHTLLLISIIEDGNVTSSSDSHPLNNDSLSTVIGERIVTFFNKMHLWNKRSPKNLTVPGITISSSFVLLNAFDSTLVIDSGIINLFRFVFFNFYIVN